MKVVFTWKLFVKRRRMEKMAEKREKEAEEAMLKRALAEKWRN
jgi:hypothetical protein